MVKRDNLTNVKKRKKKNTSVLQGNREQNIVNVKAQDLSEISLQKKNNLVLWQEIISIVNDYHWFPDSLFWNKSGIEFHNDVFGTGDSIEGGHVKSLKYDFNYNPCSKRFSKF